MQDDLSTLRAFLAYFPQPQKSHVANLFLLPVRQGHTNPSEVRAAVVDDLHERIRRAIAYRYDSARDREILAVVLREPDEALDFARWAIQYERLTPAEKQRIKNNRSAEAIGVAMDREEPTEKQVAYLRRKGYQGPIESKKFASSLIDIYTRGGRVDMSGAA